MVFSSQEFLFAFLPITLIVYYICRKHQHRNIWLLLVSIAFYAYGAREVVLVLLFSVFVNWLMALLISRTKKKKLKKIYLFIDVILNCSYLFYYKYFNFFEENINRFTGTTREIVYIALPIGISFFTFQALSYCIDVYRDSSLVQKSIVNVALYITFFPQLVAGPIVRFSTVAKEINERKTTLDDFASGSTRFVYGLGKKIIIANVLATMVDNIYAMDVSDISVGLAWLAAVGYAFQIFFDFSGYSDMAIGLGRMFGFHFEENFNFPYISKSVSEFWRRWHISLGRWFRDYIYIPLGGNRVSRSRLVFNLSVVWLCTGIWHGANWTFILWGVIYGVLIITEKMTGLAETLDKHSAVGRLYTLLAVVLLWVLFRADNIAIAGDMIKTMFALNNNPLWCDDATFYLLENWTTMILGLIVSVPLMETLEKNDICKKCMRMIRPIFVLLVLLISISFMIKGAYSPFIYFNF